MLLVGYKQIKKMILVGFNLIGCQSTLLTGEIPASAYLSSAGSLCVNTRWACLKTYLHTILSILFTFWKAPLNHKNDGNDFSRNFLRSTSMTVTCTKIVRIDVKIYFFTKKKSFFVNFLCLCFVLPFLVFHRIINHS